MKRVLKITGLILIVYLGVGYLFHYVFFPVYTPDLHNYYEPGDVLVSKRGGNTITIVSQEEGIVHIESTILPFAEGPPLHYHTGFDETFIVESGTLSMLVDGVEHTIEPGEQITITQRTPHKPFNPTADTVVVRGDLPVEFAVYLNQVYAYMDDSENNIRPPRVIFQMAVLGYRPYYEEYSVETSTNLTELNEQ